jgi:ribosomal protein S1
MLQSLNGDQTPNPNEKYQVGEEIDVKVHQLIEGGFILTTPVIEARKKGAQSSNSKREANDLKQGQIVSGVVRSIKNQCAFLQLSNMKQLMIGRLHRLEC